MSRLVRLNIISVREYNHWPLEAFDDAPLESVVQLTKRGETSKTQLEGFFRDLMTETIRRGGNLYNYVVCIF